MDIRHLVTFREIVKCKSFTKASESLNYAQSTMTMHIQTIENELNGYVFDRIGKNLVLTELGNELLSITEKLLNEFEKIESLKIENRVESSLIKIGTQESTALYRLSHIIDAYKKDNPDAKINIEINHMAALIDNLYKGNLDLLIIMQKKVNKPDLICLDLIEEELGIIGKLNVLPNISDALKLNPTIIRPSSDCEFRSTFNSYFPFNCSSDIKKINIIESVSIEFIKYNVLYNSGISLLPYIIVKNEVESGELNYFTTTQSKENRIITQLIYHQNKWINPTLETFIEYCRKYVD